MCRKAHALSAVDQLSGEFRGSEPRVTGSISARYDGPSLPESGLYLAEWTLKKTSIHAPQVLIAARRTAAALVREKTLTPTARVAYCRQLLDRNTRREDLRELASLLASLPIDERHYWVGTFYTLLLPMQQRRSQAAYFTPAHLSRNILTELQGAGFDPASHSVIDPAAGGAAFLSTVAGLMREVGVPAAIAARRLHGMDIDRGLAQLAELLIAERLGTPVKSGSIVRAGDALTLPKPPQFDAVVANPPYGRVSLSAQTAEYWKDVCHPGHINKYALFTKLSLSLAKPGGLVALVLPSSFIGGPLYDRLRIFIRSQAEILTLGAVLDREDLFVDVQQDVSVLVARVGEPHPFARAVKFSACVGRGPLKNVALAKLPVEPESAWTVPAHASGITVGGATLSSYGATVRSGYFVWNREQHRMRKDAKRKFDIPLIWAQNITAGKFCFPKAKRRKGCDFVRFDGKSSAIVRSNALVLQRTTNSSQSRRLIAARVAPKTIKKYGGFVSENHTIVITATNTQTLVGLVHLLNSAAVDARYRRLSGTANISVSLLRQLDLPTPEAFAAAMAKHTHIERAIEIAYVLSASGATKEAA
jgi:adenine-specific DNA-methyltransferase